MDDIFELHISVELNGQSVIEALAENIDFSRQQLKRILQSGAVWHESARGIERIRRAKKLLKRGELVHVYYNRQIQETEPLEAILVADEGSYSLWDKPAGMLSQGSRWGDHCTIYRWAEQVLLPQRPAYIVHRLDKATSGLIILAHKKTTAAAFSKMFEQHQIDKTYYARAEGECLFAKLPFEINTPIEGRPALTRIVQADYDREGSFTHLWIELVSGRKHQIRRHLSSIGYPIMGDRLYGANNIAVDLQLRCVKTGFICPQDGVQKNWSVAEMEKPDRI